MKLHRHESTHDWCHICGGRKDYLTDIWYPENAEHDKTDTKYIRICEDCSRAITQAARDDDRAEMDQTHEDGSPSCPNCGHGEDNSEAFARHVLHFGSLADRLPDKERHIIQGFIGDVLGDEL